jgi:hypothetical protein
MRLIRSNNIKELLGVFLLITPLFLTCCSTAAITVGTAVLSYVASVNNVGSSWLKLQDDKQQRSCQIQQNPLTDPNTIITIGPFPQNNSTTP